jgi:hypothetical protein
VIETRETAPREIVPADRRGQRVVSSALLALVLGVLVGVLAAMAGVPLLLGHLQSGMRDRLTRSFLGRSTTINTSLPTVVASIQHLQRLESVVYTMDKVVEGNRQNDYLPDFLAGDKLLLVVHGQVIAGIDLGQLRPSDVHINGQMIQLHLPPARIFVTAIESDKTRVFSRTTGLLVPADPNLETEVRQRAESEIHNAALESGILGTAETNARATLITLLQSLGFQQVSFS